MRTMMRYYHSRFMCTSWDAKESQKATSLEAIKTSLPNSYRSVINFSIDSTLYVICCICLNHL